MRGDDPLSSSADLIFVKFIAKSAGNFARECEVGVEGSNPLCSTIQSLVFRASRRIARNRRARAIRARRWNQRRPFAAPIVGIRRNLSGPDLGGSIRGCAELASDIATASPGFRVHGLCEVEGTRSSDK